MTYYANMVPSIGDDSYAEVIVRSVWNLGTASVTANRIRNAQQAAEEQSSAGDALMREYLALHDGGRTSSGSGRRSGSGSSSSSSGTRGIPRPPPVVRTQQNGSRQELQLQQQQHQKQPASGGNVDVQMALEQIAVLRKAAVVSFNQKDMEAAEESFNHMLELLMLVYPPTHPEVLRAEQSIALVQRKLRMKDVKY